jgi:cytochrome c553
MSGGKIAAGPPDWPPAANLTSDASGQLKNWQEADFVQALRKGVRPDGSTLSNVMPRVFAHMSDDEIKALWLYLQTLPAAPTGSHT